jgi:cbb3-type cytochrome oxidase subunit 3
MAIIKKTFAVVLLFMLIFGFRLPVIYNSAILVFFISIIIIASSQQSFSILQKIIKMEYVARILLAFIIIYIVSLNISIYHSTYDTTMANKFIGSFSTIVITLFFYSAVYSNLKDKNDMTKFIILAFVVQSFIQLFSLLSPEFLSVIRLFQDAHSANLMAEDSFYHGIRGLALSTELFFGLSGAYGLVLMFFMKYMLDTKTYNIRNIYLYFLILTSAFFVGRTVAVGFSFAILYFILYKGDIFKFKIIIKTILFLLLALFIMFNLLSVNLQLLITDAILPAVFDFSSKGQGQSSLRVLFESMSIITINENTILIGDGYYTKNGHYYMVVDSGYYRQILFGGIIYLLLNFIYFITYFMYGKGLQFLSKYEKYNFYLFSNIIFLYISFLHIKGETVGSGKMMMIMLFLYGINNILFLKKRKEIEANNSYNS